MDINLMMARRALPVVLFMVGLCCMATRPAAAQASGNEAERIAQLRDNAGAQTSIVQADAGLSEDSASGSGKPEAEQVLPQKPLPANEALPLGSGESSLFNSDGSAASTAGKLGDGWLLSTLAALGVVLALVFGLRWLLRRGGVVSAVGSHNAVVEVLSRTTVAPRSHVVLLRVGNRILIVNDSPNGMRTLATVEEAEEVAALLGAIEAARPSSMSKSFGGVMSRLSSAWSDSEAKAEEGEESVALEEGVTMDQARGAVSSVRSRLAVLSNGGIRA